MNLYISVSSTLSSSYKSTSFVNHVYLIWNIKNITKITIIGLKWEIEVPGRINSSIITASNTLLKDRKFFSYMESIVTVFGSFFLLFFFFN